MPWVLLGSNNFFAQLEMLRENIHQEAEVAEVSQKIFKARMSNQVTYWHGNTNASSVNLITDCTISGSFCRVTLTSKNPQIPKKSPPFASDLYLEIQQDLNNKNLVFTSDEILSPEATKMWSRLVQLGNRVSVFDTKSSSYKLKPVSDASELGDYLGDSRYRRYIFVLSENSLAQLGIQHSVAIMELKRLSLIPLFESFRKPLRNY